MASDRGQGSFLCRRLTGGGGGGTPAVCSPYWKKRYGAGVSVWGT